VEQTPSQHDQVIVEIAFVVISSAVVLFGVIVVEWSAWWVFSLTAPVWRTIGVAIFLIAASGLAARAIRLLRRHPVPTS
jgi:hypothetical protein